MIIKNQNFKEALDRFVIQNDIQVNAEKTLAIQEIIEKLMARRKVTELYEQKGLTDILAASAMFYDYYVIKGHAYTYYLLRENLAPYLNACNVSQDVQEMLFQMCESFEGEDSPLMQMIPQKGYPDDLFADAVWIYESFKA